MPRACRACERSSVLSLSSALQLKSPSTGSGRTEKWPRALIHLSLVLMFAFGQFCCVPSAITSPSVRAPGAYTERLQPPIATSAAVIVNGTIVRRIADCNQ